MARPSEYSKEIADAILQRIADGGFLSRICAEDGMPARTTFYLWMKGRTELVDAFARAKLLWADYWAEKGLLIALDSSADFFLDEDGKMVEDRASVQRARLQCDQIKWTASKYAPRVYGDRPEPDPITVAPRVTKIERVIISNNERPAAASETPRQLTYQPPKPGELTPDQWGTLRQLLEMIERAVGDRSADEVFEVLKSALLDHFKAD